MENPDHVLIVDDDRGIRELLAGYLEKNGMRVSLAANGRQMRAALENGAPDLIVLDLMLPGEDGLTLCRDLRSGKYKATPIVMLTARNEEADRILGLEMGADDYLAKPFAARELLARMRSVLRRTRMLPPNMRVAEASHRLAFGEWEVDTVARHLLDEHGVMVALSGAEYRLLRVFLDHPQRVLSRDQLLSMSRLHEAEVYDRTVDVQVRRLRLKMEADSANPALIVTERGAGYRLASDVETLY